jgi:diaminopimelate decarboxylase
VAEGGLESSSPRLEQATPPRLVLEEDRIRALAMLHGTPLYLFSEQTIRERIQRLRRSYAGFKGGVDIAYSMKANFNPAILKVCEGAGALFDVATPDELLFLERAGVDVGKAIFTSVEEAREAQRLALEKGVRYISVSSYNGFVRLAEAAGAMGRSAEVLLRVNPEVPVKAEVPASARKGKFGVPLNGSSTDSALYILRSLGAAPQLRLRGFHFHLGSQITNPFAFVRALDKLEALLARLKRERPDFELEVLDIGGGTPVSYGTPVPEPEEFARPIVERLNQLCDRLGSEFRLIVESGRYIVAEAGLLVSRVVNVKDYGDDVFIIADAGYHLLLDAALLDQPYPQLVLPEGEGGIDLAGKRVHVVGPLCDSDDVIPIAPNSCLRRVKPGDLIVFCHVGAYSTVFNMPFHCARKPPILLLGLDGEARLIRRRQSLEELYLEESA